jgi:hypothetical protein
LRDFQRKAPRVSPSAHTQRQNPIASTLLTPTPSDHFARHDAAIFTTAYYYYDTIRTSGEDPGDPGDLLPMPVSALGDRPIPDPPDRSMPRLGDITTGVCTSISPARSKQTRKLDEGGYTTPTHGSLRCSHVLSWVPSLVSSWVPSFSHGSLQWSLRSVMVLFNGHLVLSWVPSLVPSFYKQWHPIGMCCVLPSLEEVVCGSGG